MWKFYFFIFWCKRLSAWLYFSMPCRDLIALLGLDEALATEFERLEFAGKSGIF
jgi:hypothetical protein